MAAIKFDDFGGPSLDQAALLLNNAYKNMQQQFGSAVDTVDTFGKTAKANNNDAIRAVLDRASKEQLLTPGYVDSAINAVVGDNQFGFNKATINTYVDERPTVLNQRASNELTLQDSMLRTKENSILYANKKDEYDAQNYAATKTQLLSSLANATSQDERTRIQTVMGDFDNKAKGTMSPYALYKAKNLMGDYTAESYKAGNKLQDARNADVDARITRMSQPFNELLGTTLGLASDSPGRKANMTELSKMVSSGGLDLNDPYTYNKLMGMYTSYGLTQEKAKAELDQMRAQTDSLYVGMRNDTLKTEATVNNASNAAGSAALKTAITNNSAALTGAGWDSSVIDTTTGKVDNARAFANLTNKAKAFTTNIDSMDFIAGDKKPYKTLTQYATADPDGLTKAWGGYLSDPKEYLTEINKQHIPEAEKIALYKLASQGELDKYKEKGFFGVGNSISNWGENSGIGYMINEYLKPDAKNGGIPKIRSIVRADKQTQFATEIQGMLAALDQSGDSKQNFLQSNATAIQKAGITHLLDTDSQNIVKSALASSTTKAAAIKSKAPAKKAAQAKSTTKETVSDVASPMPAAQTVTQTAKKVVDPKDIPSVSNAIKSILPNQSSKYEKANIKMYANAIAKDPERATEVYKKYPKWEAAIKAELANRNK